MFVSNSIEPNATAEDVKVGDTIAVRSHVFPLTITAREVRRGFVWVEYLNQTGKVEWYRMPPTHPVTVLTAATDQ